MRQQDMAESILEVLNEVLDPTVDSAAFVDWSEPDPAVAREQAAYHAMHKMLWEHYPHEHVAIHGERLVDHDVDGLALSKRIYSQYPDRFVLIRQVEANSDPVLYMRSPRFIPEG
jgi:hypothetical protein